MDEQRTPTGYQKLVEKITPPVPPQRTAEDELDSLINVLKRREEGGLTGQSRKDPLQSLREMMINELVPIFVEIVEKYSKSGIAMQMDASNFLEGGREIRFEFGIGAYRSHLQGTITGEAIAFHETRYSPDFHGELTAGPMIRLRYLNGKTFREFICERLSTMIRTATRRR